MSARLGVLPDLENPTPLGSMLPGVYQDDAFAQGLTAALDAVLAPMLTTLDCFPAYLDPRTTPEDFGPWLATWVGLVIDENWPLDRQRSVLAETVDLYSWRGTRRGLRELTRIYTGVTPEITDGGGVSWSPTPGGEATGTGEPTVRVRVVVDRTEDFDADRLRAIVTMACPAHVRCTVEVAPQ
jgi:phage tail-like protein